jgi:hypothetical protein
MNSFMFVRTNKVKIELGPAAHTGADLRYKQGNLRHCRHVHPDRYAAAVDVRIQAGREAS